MAEILHEDGDTRLVRLSQEYYSGDDQLVQTHARFTEHSAVISRCFSISGKPKSFMLGADEMEELANAWIAYQNDMHEKAEAEAQRLAEVERKAYLIAESCPAVQITKSQYWTVSIPETGWESFDPIYNVDHLLEMVQEAVDYYQPIAEAYQLAATCSAIKIEHQEGKRHWWVAIPEQKLFGEFAERDQLVQTVQQAIEKYNQYQNKLIKENN
jgi:hypothetical protein